LYINPVDSETDIDINLTAITVTAEDLEEIYPVDYSATIL
jgi:hypothetical protein